MAADPARMQRLYAAEYANANTNPQSSRYGQLPMFRAGGTSIFSIQTYSIRTQLSIFMLEHPGLGAWDINHTVNDGMRHMDPLWSELPGK